MEIRQETTADYTTVENLTEEAFRQETFSDHREHILVNKLRRSKAFIPELSLVMTDSGKIVGHILLTEISIDGKYPTLALAPVSVLPGYQGKGIGSALINEAHRRAKELGYSSVIVLGHKDYYPRFGFRKLSEFGISMPFDIEDEYCMALELQPEGLKGIRGTVVYPPEFD